MDEQRELALPGFVAALWATRKPHVFIGIEKEAVTRCLLPKLFHGSLSFNLARKLVSRPNTAVSGFPTRGFAACVSSVILLSYLPSGLLM